MDKMEVTVKNLGAVKNATIDLKPLTVFVGKNNSGKTWTAYAISSFFTNETQKEYTINYSEQTISDSYPEIDKLIEDITREGTGKFDIVDFFEKYHLEYLNNLSRHAKHWIDSFFGTDRVSFNDLEIIFKPSGELKENVDRLLSNPIAYNPKIGVSEGNKEGLLQAVKDKDSRYVFFITKGDIGEKIPIKVIRYEVANQIFLNINKALYNNVQYFPADRTGLISLIAGANVRKRDHKEKISDNKEDNNGKNLPSPIGCMFDLVVKTKNKAIISKREIDILNDPKLQKYVDLASILQKQILGGDLELIKKESGDIDDIIFKYGDNKIELDLAMSSSAVKDLTQLVMYLKYFAKPGDLLIIDEPEMNLHPEAQVKLMEFLSILVNSDLKLIITTHSPYFVDQLVNLIKAEKSQKKVEIQDKFLLKNPKAFIAQKQVSIYLFGEGNNDSSIQDLLKPDGRIKWTTFSRVSEYMSSLNHQL